MAKCTGVVSVGLIRDRRWMKTSFAVIAASTVLAASGLTHAAQETILYRFKGGPDGMAPIGKLAIDAAGTLYGSSEGAVSSGTGQYGTIFALVPGTTWQFQALYRFAGGVSGFGPGNGLVRRADGALFGVAQWGPDGRILELAPPTAKGKPWSYSQIGPLLPYQDVALSPAGDLYGVADSNFPGGSIFKLSTASNSFDDGYIYFNGTNGAMPNGHVTFSGGKIYGTTVYSTRTGNTYSGGGSVYEASGSGSPVSIFKFSNSTGINPLGGVVADSSGNLFGTTTKGGKYGCGTVFKLQKPLSTGQHWQLTVLHQFMCTEGQAQGELSLFEGKLYGVANFGQNSDGLVFQLTPPITKSTAWAYSVLHNFQGGKDGADPLDGVVVDAGGNLFGTTNDGGAGCPKVRSNGCGTVYEIVP